MARGLRHGARACVLLLALALAGCASLRGTGQPLSPEAQRQLLRELPAFSIRGSAGVNAPDPATGERKGFNASLTWEEKAGESAFRLSGPFGAGTLLVTWRPGYLRLAGGRDELYEGELAEQVLLDQLGFIPPFESLRYWVLGIEAPGEAPVRSTLDDAGHFSELEQQQWRIRYTRRGNVRSRGGTVALPERLVVTRDDLRLTVVIHRWKL